MKEITMPTNIDPIRVDINGVKYEYRAGQTVEVPDEVAAVIENVINNQPTNMPYTKFATEEYVDNAVEKGGGGGISASARLLSDISTKMTERV
jgi:hypothetical protein